MDDCLEEVVDGGGEGHEVLEEEEEGKTCHETSIEKSNAAVASIVPWYRFENLQMAQGYNTVSTKKKTVTTFCFAFQLGQIATRIPRFPHTARLFSCYCTFF